MNDLKAMFLEDKIEEDLKNQIKKQGVKSDLLKLTGGLSSIVPIIKDIKEKSDKNKKSQKWLWSPFYNPARPDGVNFYHWQKEDLVHTDYEYSKLNTKINIVSLKEEEYNLFSSQLDSDWDWDETKYLWDLCKEYDLRFIVIADRYNYKNERTIEELKARYYGVSKKILELRKQFDHPILKTGYSYEQEIKRRAYLEKSLDKKNEVMQFTKYLFDNAVEVQDKLEKMQGIINREKHGFNIGLINDEGKMEDINFEQYIVNKDKLDSSFCYLRSNKLFHPLPISEKIQKKVDFSLKELGVPEKLICSNRVVDMFDKLKNNLIIYLSLKKHLEKKSREKNQLESLYESNIKTKNLHQNAGSHKHHSNQNSSQNGNVNFQNNSNNDHGK
jgi:hypothetical protein